MSKAILVIDEMPECCGECLCFIERDRFDGNEWHSACYKLRKEVSDYDKPHECPLRPMPEQKKGKWIDVQDPYGFFETIPVCSECGCTTKMRDKYNFCPNCGADMRGENESNTCD